MMWQSEGISRLRCSHAFSSVTDEQPSCRVGAQSANKAAEPFRAPPLPSFLTLPAHTAPPAGGLESSSLTNGLHKPHSQLIWMHNVPSLPPLAPGPCMVYH